MILPRRLRIGGKRYGTRMQDVTRTAEWTYDALDRMTLEEVGQ